MIRPCADMQLCSYRQRTDCFDLAAIAANRLAACGDIPLAAVGIVLKPERIPVSISLGVCLGMGPLIACDYGAGNRARMMKSFSLARVVILSEACVCASSSGSSPGPRCPPSSPTRPPWPGGVGEAPPRQ